MKKTFCALTLSALFISSYVNAGSNEPTGMKPRTGPNDLLGYIRSNPFENAPLTALVTLNGHEISKVHVSIKPKTEDGVKLEYDVGDMRVMDYGGVPIIGLYPNFLNTFTVTWQENGDSKEQTYKLLTPEVDLGANADRWSQYPIVTVDKVDPEFKDRLYLLNWTQNNNNNAILSHNNPFAPGAFAWDGTPGVFIIDTHGDVRWYLNPYTTHNSKDYYGAGYAMGFNELKGGDWVWLQGQATYRMDLMGRMIWKHHLPGDFIDGSHEIIPDHKGNYFIKVARKDYLDPETKKLVYTIRDQVIEVDESGKLVDFWDMNKILDNKRDDVLKALDAGAVCLNIDTDKEGTTTSDDEILYGHRGDSLGVGVGRNWLHMNSIYPDPTDDSIIISSRHQSAVIKIGRDHKVKWILSPKKGWTGELASKVLTPIDTDGKTIQCSDTGICDNSDSGFDFVATQHTGYKIENKSSDGHTMLSVFDNGDARRFTQPAMSSMKYSRGVIYDIDETNMTVKQTWQYGKKELGSKGYSAVTGINKYEADKDSMLLYFTTPYIFGIGGSFSNNDANIHKDEHLGHVKSILTEFKYGEKTPAVQIRIDSNQLFALPYRAQTVHLNMKD